MNDTRTVRSILHLFHPMKRYNYLFFHHYRPRSRINLQITHKKRHRNPVPFSCWKQNVILVIDQPYVNRIQSLLSFFELKSYCIILTKSVY